MVEMTAIHDGISAGQAPARAPPVAGLESVGALARGGCRAGGTAAGRRGGAGAGGEEPRAVAPAGREDLAGTTAFSHRAGPGADLRTGRSQRGGPAVRRPG